MGKARRSYRKKTKKSGRRTRRKLSGGKGRIGMGFSGRSRGSSSGSSRGSSFSHSTYKPRHGAEWGLPDTEKHLPFTPETPFSGVYKNIYTGKELFTLTVGPYVASQEPDLHILPEYTPVLKYHMDFTNGDLTTPELPSNEPPPKASMFGSWFSSKPEPVKVQTAEEIKERNLSTMSYVVSLILDRIGIIPDSFLPKDPYDVSVPSDKKWQPSCSLTIYSYRSPKETVSNKVTVIIKTNSSIYKPSSSRRLFKDEVMELSLQDYFMQSQRDYNTYVERPEEFDDAEYLLQVFLNKRFSDDTIVLSQ
jgi:hypothetical protein